jgi:5-(aminomethyl)-3-furanmethanol phosphate kinase
MWIVKVGGSLSASAQLPAWLELLAQLGGGRVTLVCGGGRFADEVRRTQSHWQFDDLAAHNMAVLAMAQTAYLLQALNPALQLARSESEIHRVLHKGRAAVWLPTDRLREQPDAHTNWDVTSDSIALDLARRLNAERLVLVKPCPIDPLLTLVQHGEAGVVDRRFAAWAEGAAFPIELLNEADLPRMRSLLIGEVRLPA